MKNKKKYYYKEKCGGKSVVCVPKIIIGRGTYIDVFVQNTSDCSAACSASLGESDHGKPRARVPAESGLQWLQGGGEKWQRAGRARAGRQQRRAAEKDIHGQSRWLASGEHWGAGLHCFGCLLCTICFSFTKLLELDDFFLAVMGNFFFSLEQCVSILG